MATIYKTRRKCGEEDLTAPEGALGKGRGWHYVYEDQTIIDEDAECPDHPTATVEHFVVLSEEIT